MAIPQFTTPVPKRTDPEAVFIVRADTLVGELPPFVAALNDEIVNINTRSDQVAANTVIVSDAKDAALSASNFKGAWELLAGALQIPASVSHNGALWLLMADLADAGLSEPSEENNDWLKLDFLSEAVFFGRTLTAGAGLLGGGDLAQDVAFSVDFATVANLRAGAQNKVLDAAGVYAASAPVTSSGSGSFTLNFNSGRNFVRTLTGNSTLANPSNQSAGQSGLIIVKQDGTGGRTLSFGSNWNLPPVTLIAPAANAVSLISYYVAASGEIYATITEDFS